MSIRSPRRLKVQRRPPQRADRRRRRRASRPIRRARSRQPRGELDTLVPAYAMTIHKTSLGISRSRDPRGDPALHDARQKPALHGRHPQQAPRRSGGAEEGHRHRRPRRHDEATVDEIAGMAGCAMKGKRT